MNAHQIVLNVDSGASETRIRRNCDHLFGSCFLELLVETEREKYVCSFRDAVLRKRVILPRHDSRRGQVLAHAGRHIERLP